ncbi:MAG: 6,7-dimethyl-8-ribityllumazine synthase [Acidobacteriota bacterium]|nr:6,7-dimethyl-8-ribityllumazine synthase [Acidobacteriota bacterium]MDH3528937.1 6,7-dimethyl-8-ribityllumazine synthase [Acidobacteriota bacterium]
MLEPKVIKGKLDARGFKFAIIESSWNDFLTSRLTMGALETLEKHGAKAKDIEIFKVPGSFELPLTAKKVAETGGVDAIICLGVVIRGETPHFDYVAGEAASGISRVGLETGVPVLFGVITADTVEQALNRAGVKAGNKGAEAAASAIEIVNLFKAIGGGKKPDKAFPHAV